MFLLLFLIFILMVVLAEIYIYRKNIAVPPPKRWKKWYKASSIILWVLFILGFAWLKIAREPADSIFKFYEVVVLIFIFVGLSKIIFTILSWIGRKVGKLPWFYTLATVLIIMLNCIMTYGATTGRWTVRTERVDIVTHNVPENLDGLRIAVFSDVHAGHLLDKHDILQKTVDSINELDADIVINCGDIINNSHEELGERSMAILSGLHSRYGVFSVLGNHDLGIYVHDSTRLSPRENIRLLVEKQESLGWKVLRNQTDIIVKDNDTLYITGLEFPEELIRRGHRKVKEDQHYGEILAGVPEGASSIVISHAPQVWDQILATGKSNLMVSGHIHSMQMKIKFGKGREWSPARLWYERWSGLYEEGGRYLYINDGIGYTIVPMRIWTKPEVTLIELRNNEDNSFCGDIQ